MMKNERLEDLYKIMRNKVTSRQRHVLIEIMQYIIKRSNSK